jgi:hypothetical protein
MKFDKQSREALVVQAGTYMFGVLMFSVLWASLRTPRTLPVILLFVVVLCWRELILARMRGELTRRRREQQGPLA